ncbi:hypothetical protein K438DRAFT_17159 [Mycena galopus ATCC 62051]|nr:hypothetical protein K438DRAFT_17159 [Mycena galopus ATCC 62051]
MCEISDRTTHYTIDYLHNDRRTLVACSLVCRAWSASSRYHLFQNAGAIHVHRHNFQKFCALLASQHLNAYIGRLHLHSHTVDHVFVERSNETLQFNQHLKCLTGLSCLKYLHLGDHHHYVHPDFLAGLTQNFASITDLELTSMHFSTFAQFIQVVDSLPLLCRVSLDQDVRFYDHLDYVCGYNTAGPIFS